MGRLYVNGLQVFGAPPFAIILQLVQMRRHRWPWLRFDFRLCITIIDSNIDIIIPNLRLRYLNLLLKIFDPILKDRNVTIPALESQPLSQD
jgi:hypothetical protein